MKATKSGKSGLNHLQKLSAERIEKLIQIRDTIPNCSTRTSAINWAIDNCKLEVKDENQET